jgi:hypothetical protein
MYISPTERMKKIHIWIGVTSKSEEEFFNYFDQDNDNSQFSKDIALNSEYDEDFIGIIPMDRNIPIKEIFENDVPIDTDDIPQVEKECYKLGLESANAVFYLTDSSVKIENIGKKYNGLYYI